MLALHFHTVTLLFQHYALSSIFAPLSFRCIPLFLVITSFVWWHLLCPFAQQIFYPHLSFPYNPLLNCLLSLKVSFFHQPPQVPVHSIFCITCKVTCPQAAYFLPYLLFPFAPSVCVRNTGTSFNESDIVLCWPCYCPENEKFVFLCHSWLLITLLEAMREFL